MFQVINDTLQTNAPPPCIIWINLLTKFPEDGTLNVTSKVLTRKNVPPPSGNVFKQTRTTFQLIQDVIGTYIVTKDQTKHLASRMKMPIPLAAKKNAPPSDGHVFQQTRSIFKLNQDVFGVYVLTKFHRLYHQLVFQPTETIFELVQDIIGTYL
ncbi:hypothetical protein DPMN_127254 [Dreissena polymorpha]|uniref:Uncharacterized protein n=1 Tax=Dreissena polymorpha TaxID=45954 RepID=A0A9D4JWC5_DREPO|nr:hypothetical protein DPMN_127254 [Dreissena polymorpha]